MAWHTYLGERGTFAKSITIPSTHTVGAVRIEVRDVSEADGSLFTSTTVQVFVIGGPRQQPVARQEARTGLAVSW